MRGSLKIRRWKIEMVGIYKITNQQNQKSYIGQSIHCGKRFDEHYKGN
jgi:predicted GIY-YIG superfamily endonuclease